MEKTKQEIIRIVDGSKDIAYLIAVLTFVKIYPNNKKRNR